LYFFSTSTLYDPHSLGCFEGFSFSFRISNVQHQKDEKGQKVIEIEKKYVSKTDHKREWKRFKKRITTSSFRFFFFSSFCLVFSSSSHFKCDKSNFCIIPTRLFSFNNLSVPFHSFWHFYCLFIQSNGWLL
jgi:hypothetical protein